MVSKSVRFYFDNIEAAAGGLLAVLLHARDSDKDYRFGGLEAQTVFTSGLFLEGDIDEVAAILDELPGVVRQDE